MVDPRGSADRGRGWLSRQLGTMVLSQVQPMGGPASLRAAAWHNTALKLGLALPLFVVHDLGVLLTALPSSYRLGPRPALELAGQSPEGREVRGLAALYRALLASVLESEVIAKAASSRLRDEVVAVLIARVVGEPFRRHEARALPGGGAAFAAPLPLDPAAYQEAESELARRFADFDAGPLLGFVRALVDARLEVTTAVERIDVDTLRLMGLLGEGAGGALDLVDLHGALDSVEGRDVVDFSLELLPSVLETRRAAGVQSFAVDGYASIERQGSPDSILPTEFAWDEAVFERKVVDDELYYYGRERQREEQRRLHYVLVDSSPSMRGTRGVFARGLALALCKKLALRGDDVWLRFFDSRLHDLRRLGHGDFAVPYLLGFRSERGRNYGRVFRQLLVEVERLAREDPRRMAIYVLTHGQAHLPPDVVEKLARRAFLYGIFILPSQEVRLDYLPLLHRHQIVDAEALGSRAARRGRALDILDDAAHAGGGAGLSPTARPAPGKRAVPEDPGNALVDEERG